MDELHDAVLCAAVRYLPLSGLDAPARITQCSGPHRAHAPGRERRQHIMPLFGHALTERLQTGLAPDIPEDLYMLIKKVRFPCYRSMVLIPAISAPGHFILLSPQSLQPRNLAGRIIVN